MDRPHLRPARPRRHVAAVDGATDLSQDATGPTTRRVASRRRSATPPARLVRHLDAAVRLDRQPEAVTDGDTKVTKSVRDDLGRSGQALGPTSAATRRCASTTPRTGSCTINEAVGSGVRTTHTFTFDNLGRPLVANYAGTCHDRQTIPTSRASTTASAGRRAARRGTSCTNLGGRLAYVKVKLMCQTSLADKTLEQETWYGYDAAGRLTHEYISDDNGRTAAHVYAWTKNGALQQTTLPSTVVLGATFGSVGSNSDTDRVTALWRTNDVDTDHRQRPLRAVRSAPAVQPAEHRRAPVCYERGSRAISPIGQTLNIVEKTDRHEHPELGDRGRRRRRVAPPAVTTTRAIRRSPAATTRSTSTTSRTVCSAKRPRQGPVPTSGSTLKNNHSASPALHRGGRLEDCSCTIPGSTGVSHVFGLYRGYSLRSTRSTQTRRYA